MGRGAMLNTSKKLGLVTTISTETEIVADGKRFPKCAWFRYFRLAQGDEAKEDSLMQVNEPCTLLHKNHPFSVGKGSKHTNIRCFFVVDNIRKHEVKIVHYPTDEMVEDFSTKPLQGKMFVIYRNTMLGINPEDFSEHKKWCMEAIKRCWMTSKGI